MNNKQVMTPKEVAEELKISEPTVLRLLNRGELRGWKVGRQWRIFREDFTAYIESSKR